jgi:hypothetical protein
MRVSKWHEMLKNGSAYTAVLNWYPSDEHGGGMPCLARAVTVGPGRDNGPRVGHAIHYLFIDPFPAEPLTSWNGGKVRPLYASMRFQETDGAFGPDRPDQILVYRDNNVEARPRWVHPGAGEYNADVFVVHDDTVQLHFDLTLRDPISVA